MRIKFTSILIITLISLSANPSGSVDAIARLIKVPLTSVTTQGTGAFGQPTISYYASVSVGTPPKSFKIQFDLNTNELFLPQYSWNPFYRNMHYNVGFNCKESTSCVQENTLYNFEYQHVKMTGKRYEDVATLNMVHLNASTGPTVGPISWRQSFIAVHSASDGRFRPLPVDGFFGLGPAPKSMTGVKDLLTSLHMSNQIDNLQFSLQLNPVLDTHLGGTLVLGGVDTNLYHDKIYWHSLSSANPDKWTLGLQSVSLGYQVFACGGSYGRGCQARFSSGLSDIYGPRDDVLRLYSWLITTKSPSGLPLIDCRRIPGLPVITFTIDGIPYYLQASNYIRKTVDGSIFATETCYVAILPSNDDAITWTLSTPFLGAYYSVFDATYHQIGFAALR